MGNFSCKLSCDFCKKDDLTKTMLLSSNIKNNIINPPSNNARANEINSNSTKIEIIGQNTESNMINVDNMTHEGVLVSNQN